ncbi:MAG: branched-chain amino acid ABC transporter permease [Desulfatiglandales bacterium]
MASEVLLQAIVAGLLFGMVLSVVALGLTIIFGVMDIVNFAHGEFLMIGMYTGLLVSQYTGTDPLFALPVAAVIGGLLGYLCYWLFVRLLLRGPMLAQLLGTFGLMLFLRNVALLLFGSEDRSIQKGILVGKSVVIFGSCVVPATKLGAAVLAVLAFVGTYLFIEKTKIGKALQATAINPQAARFMGISTDRMNALAWVIGGAGVTVAGGLLVNFWAVNPYVGLLFTMLAFTIVALGGFGSVPGAFFAGLIVGIITEFPGIWDAISLWTGWNWMYKVPMISFKYTWVYLAYFLIMLITPQGLFGWKR